MRASVTAVAAAPRRHRIRGSQARWLALTVTWESVLFLLFVAVVAGNSLLSPYFLDVANLLDATSHFTEKAIVAMPMAFVILCGDIDISVASIIALSSLCMGIAADAGASTGPIMGTGAGVGLLAGLFNGLLITRLRLSSVAVTIGTMSLFRGIASAVLGDRAYTQYPSDFAALGQRSLLGLVPVQFVVFCLVAAVAVIALKYTVLGRYVCAIGNNPVASRFSGVPVQNVRLGLFAGTGLLSGVAAILLTSRIGSTRPNLALGWELDIITTVVLGGVAITGVRDGFRA